MPTLNVHRPLPSNVQDALKARLEQLPVMYPEYFEFRDSLFEALENPLIDAIAFI